MFPGLARTFRQAVRGHAPAEPLPSHGPRLLSGILFRAQRSQLHALHWIATSSITLALGYILCRGDLACDDIISCAIIPSTFQCGMTLARQINREITTSHEP